VAGGGTRSDSQGRSRSRFLLAAAGLGAVALLVGALSLARLADAQVSGSQCGPVPNGSSVTFSRGGSHETFTVPPGVSKLHVTAEGGHGGQDSSTYHGGSGGGLDADVTVMPGECLTVYVGDYGFHHGGGGWGHGGDHGTIPGTAGDNGHSAAGGGGASALVRGSTPLVVAGGGGGGGGDSDEARSGGGGAGGDGGGEPFSDGQPGNFEHEAVGGSGGQGGAARGRNGGGGTGVGSGTLIDAGAGGGGGGGNPGGTGGHVVPNPKTSAGGGGGGGGASSGGDSYFTSSRGRGGEVSISWQMNALGVIVPTSSQLLPVNGLVPINGQPVPLFPVIRPLNLDTSSVVSDGLPLSIGPGADTGTPLVLNVYASANGGWTQAVTQSVVADPMGFQQVKLDLPRKVRKHLRHSKRGKLRLDVITPSTGELTSRHRLVVD
jgi:hypothetical protein